MLIFNIEKALILYKNNIQSRKMIGFENITKGVNPL